MATANRDTAARADVWRIAQATIAFASVVWGDAAMVAVTAFCRRFGGDLAIVQWLTASTIVAIGAYLLTGLPQIKAVERRDAVNGTPETSRDRWAVRQLARTRVVGFVAASVIGGPLVVGWYYGRKRDPRARSLTWVAAWILGLVWCGIYSGLFSWIGD